MRYQDRVNDCSQWTILAWDADSGGGDTGEIFVPLLSLAVEPENTLKYKVYL